MVKGWNDRTDLWPALAVSFVLVFLVSPDRRLPGGGTGLNRAVCAAQVVAQTPRQGQEEAEKANVADAGVIPPVQLTTGHRKLCRIDVGDRLPPIKLPRLDGEVTDLVSLRGKQATVVLFWQDDRWMTRGAIRDFSMRARQWAKQGVELVGIASGLPTATVEAQQAAVQTPFPSLLDTNGRAFSLVSASDSAICPPWVYVLDAKGDIVWFDIEYSEATRRELRQTIRVLQTGR